MEKLDRAHINDSLVTIDDFVQLRINYSNIPSFEHRILRLEQDYAAASYQVTVIMKEGEEERQLLEDTYNKYLEIIFNEES